MNTYSLLASIVIHILLIVCVVLLYYGYTDPKNYSFYSSQGMTAALVCLFVIVMALDFMAK